MNPRDPLETKERHLEWLRINRILNARANVEWVLTEFTEFEFRGGDEELTINMNDWEMEADEII